MWNAFKSEEEEEEEEELGKETMQAALGKGSTLCNFVAKRKPLK